MNLLPPGALSDISAGTEALIKEARRRQRRRYLLTGLAAVALLAAVTGFITARQFGPGRRTPGQGSFRAPAAAAPAASPATPAFFVAQNWTMAPSAFVVNAVTGARRARIRLPFPAKYFAGVATGNGRTFVAAEAKPSACQTVLYRFVLAASGTPTTLTRFAAVPGVVSTPWDMAVLGNGQTIAYDTTACGHPYLAMVNTATGQAKRWTFTQGPTIRQSLPPCYGDKSLSASESTIGFCDRVVPASAAPGPLALRGRIIAHNGEFGRTTIIGGMDVAPDGKTAYFATFRVQHDKPAGRNWQLRAIDLATGQASLIRSFPGTPGTEAAAAADPTGRYLLIEYAPHSGGTRLARLDLKTKRLTRLGAGWAIEAAIAW